jgi:hypothetical protein
MEKVLKFSEVGCTDRELIYIETITSLNFDPRMASRNHNKLLLNTQTEREREIREWVVKMCYLFE